MRKYLEYSPTAMLASSIIFSILLVSGCAKQSNYLNLNKINSAVNKRDSSGLDKRERAEYDLRLANLERRQRAWDIQQRRLKEQNRQRLQAQRAAAVAAKKRAEEAKIAADNKSIEDWNRGLRMHFRSKGFEPASAMVALRQKANDTLGNNVSLSVAQAYMDSLAPKDRELTYKVFSRQGQELVNEWIDINQERIDQSTARLANNYLRYLQQLSIQQQSRPPIQLGTPQPQYPQQTRTICKDNYRGDYECNSTHR